MAKREFKGHSPEKKKKIEKENVGSGDGAGAAKEEVGRRTLELKVDIHCEGCALKLRKAVKDLYGVDEVRTNSSFTKLKVIGKIDPSDIREFVEAKTQKKVQFTTANTGDGKKMPAGSNGGEKEEYPKKSDEKKPKQESTVVLKIHLHCEGCIRRIKKTIWKIKGVDGITIGVTKDLVTVKGTMEVKTLPEYLSDKLNRAVEVVQPKKEGKSGEEKKEKKEKGEKENGGGPGSGGEKKNKGGEGGKGGGDGGEKKKEIQKNCGGEKGESPAVAAVAEGHNMVQHYYYYHYPGTGFPHYGYRMEPVNAPAPQLFSDDNPNACRIM